MHLFPGISWFDDCATIQCMSMLYPLYPCSSVDSEHRIRRYRHAYHEGYQDIGRYDHLPPGGAQQRRRRPQCMYDKRRLVPFPGSFMYMSDCHPPLVDWPGRNACDLSDSVRGTDIDLIRQTCLTSNAYRIYTNTRCFRL